MSAEPLACIEIEPPPSPQGTAAGAAVIWLHGLGASGHDFEPVARELGLPEEMGVRFLFPHAPEMPVTLNAGHVMPAWYDLYSLDFAGDQDEAGIRAAQGRVEALIEREVARGVPRHRIVLAGFSQGGAVALHTALRQAMRLAGVMALSTYLPLPHRAEEERNAAVAGTPLFVGDGRFDGVVPLTAGERAADTLRGPLKPRET